jgi:hypothetical protein
MLDGLKESAAGGNVSIMTLATVKCRARLSKVSIEEGLLFHIVTVHADIGDRLNKKRTVCASVWRVTGQAVALFSGRVRVAILHARSQFGVTEITEPAGALHEETCQLAGVWQVARSAFSGDEGVVLAACNIRRQINVVALRTELTLRCR